MHKTTRILNGQLRLPLEFLLHLIHTHITKPQTQWGSVHAENKTRHPLATCQYQLILNNMLISIYLM